MSLTNGEKESPTIEILFAGNIPLDDLEALKDRFIVHNLIEAENKSTFLSEVGEKIMGLVVTGFGGYDKKLLDALPNLQMVSVWGGLELVNLIWMLRSKEVLR